MRKQVHTENGNTRFIAETIAGAINADMAALKPKRTLNASGMMMIAWGVRQLVNQSEPKLLPLEKNPADYDLIILGTPVWTYTFAPPVRTFLKQNAMSGKKIALFCCHGGQKGKTLENMKVLLNGNSILGENDFMEPVSHEQEDSRKKAITWAKKMAME